MENVLFLICFQQVILINSSKTHAAVLLHTHTVIWYITNSHYAVFFLFLVTYMTCHIFFMASSRSYFHIEKNMALKMSYNIKSKVFNNFSGPYWPARVFSSLWPSSQKAVFCRYGPADCSECKAFCLFISFHSFKSPTLKSNSQFLLPYVHLFFPAESV